MTRVTWIALNSIVFSVLLPLAVFAAEDVPTGTWSIVPVHPASMDGGIQMKNHPDTGDPAIAYFDWLITGSGSNTAAPRVKYTTLQNGNWDVDVIETFSDYFISDWDVCLDFHPQTKSPSITYYDGSWNLYLATRVGDSQWNKELVDSNVAGSTITSFAFDSQGIPWIAYLANNEGKPRIKIAKNNGANWTISLFEEDAILLNIAIDPATGRPSIAYYKILSYVPPQVALMYAHHNGSSWIKEAIDDGSYEDVSEGSLTFNPVTHYPAVAYCAGTDHMRALRIARWTGTSWAKEIVDDRADIWGEIELAYDPVIGTPAIVYSIDTGSANYSPPAPLIPAPLMYAEYNGASWTREAITFFDYANIVSEKTLTFSSRGVPRVAFSGLNYAYRLFQGDVDGDGDIGLSDAINSLQALSGMETITSFHQTADVNQDKKIGTEEVIFILQKISGLR
jgi:hypothetical protein